MALSEPRFVIISAAHAGAKLLARCLGKHQDVKIYHEVFRADTANRIGEYAGDQVFRSNTNDVIVRVATNPYQEGQDAGVFIENAMFYSRYGQSPSSVGFTFLYHHAHQNANARKAWEYLQQNQHIRIIHLVRRDMIDPWIALELALRSGQEVANPPPEQSENRHFSNVKGFQQHLVRINKYKALVRKLFQFHSVLEIEYEQDLHDNRRPTLDKVQAFVGVENQSIDIAVKDATVPSNTFVSNYDALAMAQRALLAQ